MKVLGRTSYWVFSAIEIVIVHLVIAAMLVCALFDTLLLRSPSRHAGEGGEV